MGKARRKKDRRTDKAWPSEASVLSDRSILNRPLPILLVLILLAFLVNFNVLSNGFGWDDETIIPGLGSTDPSWSYLFPDRSDASTRKSGSPYFRPLVSASYRLDYLFWSHRPFGFHLSVLVAHLLNTALVFFLTRRLLIVNRYSLSVNRNAAPPTIGQTHRSAPTNAGDPSGRPYILFPLIAATLFAVHPIHAEAVAWIAGRNDVFCTTFLLLSFLL